MNHLQFKPLQGPFSMKAGVLQSEMALVEKSYSNEYLFKKLEERKAANSPRQFTMHRPQEQVYIGDPYRIRWRENLREDDQIVNLVPVVGMIVRDYSWWAYSGVEIRESILSASEDPLVRAHLLYINSPGGVSAALPDVKYAIEFAHGKGIPVFALIDGMADSLAYGIASLCDKIYFMNPEDEVGSVGTYWSFWGTKNGAKDNNGNTFVEIYDSESFDKNKSYRDALNGDETEALQELKYYRDYLYETVTKGRPNMVEDQLHGKTFRAKDVIGTMVDSMGNLLEAASAAVAAFDSFGKEKKNAPASLSTISNSEQLKGGVSTGTPSSNDSPSVAIAQSSHNQQENKPTKTVIQMKLEHLCTLLGVGSMEVDEEKGCYIQQSQLELIEDRLAEMKTSLETVTTDKQELETRVATAEAETTRLTSELSELQNTHTAYVHEQTEKLETANTKIAELEQENQVLSKTTSAPASVVQKTDNNDLPVDAKTDPDTVSSIKEDMSLDEKIKVVNESKKKAGLL